MGRGLNARLVFFIKIVSETKVVTEQRSVLYQAVIASES